MKQNSIKNGSFKSISDYVKKNGETVRLMSMFAIVCAVLALVDGKTFYSGANLINMAKQFPDYSLMALGIMLAMITGGIDLSTVGIANLCSVVSSLTLLRFVPKDASTGRFILVFIICIIGSIIIGAICGMFNGILVSTFGIPPMVATMGTMLLYTGICMVLTEGSAITGITPMYSEVMTHNLFGFLPVSVLIFSLCFIFTWVLLEKTPFGIKVYMLGTNPKATKIAGIKNKKILISIYMISGIFAAFASLIMLGRMNSARSDFGGSYTSQALLIVILGGTNPSGGYGKMSGILLSIIIMQFVSTGISMIPSFSSYIKTLIWGLILIAVIILNWYGHRKNTRVA